MILGTGIDSIEIHRFASWIKYSDKQLEKIFSPDEILYCRSNSCKSAERFAVRFAAREALFKAMSFLNQPISFLKLCKATQIIKNFYGKPQIIIQWELLNRADINCIIWLSLTHTVTTATAFVIIEKKSR